MNQYITRRKWYEKWIKESRAILAKEIDIPEEEKTNVFWWCGWGLQGTIQNIDGIWCWIPPRIGCRVEYRDGRDLTAWILDWHFDHQVGDVPIFFLRDLIDAVGPLWNEDLCKIIWKHLEVKK
jgi:hypothetical protein